MNEPIRSRSALKQENEALADLATQEALRRNAAEDIAALEILQRQQAENAAIDARVAANQVGFQAAQLNTERELLRDNLAAERASASNANFGLILLSAIALVGLLAFGIWYVTGSNRNAASAGATTQTARSNANTAGHPATVTTPLPSSPTHTEYHPASPAVKIPTAKAKAAKVSPATTPRPSKTPVSSATDSDYNAASDSDADKDNADSSADSNASDNSSDAAGTDAKAPDNSTGK